MKKKNLKVRLFLVLLMFVIASGCKSFSSSAVANNASNANNSSVNNPQSSTNKNFRDPIILEAKMVENLPAPADAELVPDKEKKPAWLKKMIKLKSPAAAYDIAHFYRQQMVKNGWANDPSNDEQIKSYSISRFYSLIFDNETETAKVEIIPSENKGSEITISVENISK